MRIVQVGYRRNRPRTESVYNHEHVECFVEVGPNDSPEEALQYAKNFVEDGLGLTTPEQRKIRELERELALKKPDPVRETARTAARKVAETVSKRKPYAKK